MSNYDLIKERLVDQGFPTTEGDGFQGLDFASYELYSKGVTYNSGEPYDQQKAFVGLAYVAELPKSVADDAEIEQPEPVDPIPDPNAIARSYGAVNELGQKENGTLWMGSGNSSDGFVLVSNGDLELGISVRYRFTSPPIDASAREISIPAMNENGRAWAVALSGISLGQKIITDRYFCRLTIHAIAGDPDRNINHQLTWSNNRYVLFQSPWTEGRDYVAQEIVPMVKKATYPEDVPLYGKYSITLEARSFSTGQTLTNTVVVNAY